MSVFMDVQMPRVDGLEATRRIVQEGIPTKVVILTTFERDDIEGRSGRALVLLGARSLLLVGGCVLVTWLVRSALLGEDRSHAPVHGSAHPFPCIAGARPSERCQAGRRQRLSTEEADVPSDLGWDPGLLRGGRRRPTASSGAARRGRPR